jgi:hypothetical protein
MQVAAELTQLAGWISHDVGEPDRDRFARVELQEAYEDGFDQEYDHDSFVLLDRFAWMLDEADSAVLGAERIAAMLDGAADALHALARARRNDLPALRRLVDLDGAHGETS